MKLSPAVKLAIQILEDHGYTVEEVTRNKHIRIKAAGLAPIFYSVTPSDHRANLNFIAQIKRVVRQAGASCQ